MPGNNVMTETPLMEMDVTKTAKLSQDTVVMLLVRIQIYQELVFQDPQ